MRRDGYGVTWLNRGTVAITFAHDQQPNFIVLDLRLPDLSEHDVCRQMRQLGLHQPILMLTVLAEEIDKVLGLEIGADDYMTKSYSLRELLSRVRALLRRAYGEVSTAAPDADMLSIRDMLKTCLNS